MDFNACSAPTSTGTYLSAYADCCSLHWQFTARAGGWETAGTSR